MIGYSQKSISAKCQHKIEFLDKNLMATQNKYAVRFKCSHCGMVISKAIKIRR